MAPAEGIGTRIAQALKTAGMKPVELARRLNVSQPTVHGWVNEIHGITWSNIRRVATVLTVAPGWLMFGADEEAERVAQTPEELAFLRLFRELDDSGQASVLRLLAAMQRPAPNQPIGPSARRKRPESPRPIRS
jgi:transcriptional regulator with XRE-family HTH domain